VRNLSVVFVTYNNLNDFEKTFQSTKDLEHIICEIIIVDSSSNTEIAMYAKNLHVNIKVIYLWERPLGIYHAMNSALQKAQNENWIWYLNPGDILLDSALFTRLLNIASNERADWGFAQALKQLRDVREIFPIEVTDWSSKAVALGKLSISHQAMICKVSTLRALGGFDEKYRIAADLKMQIQLASYGKPTFLPGVIVGIDPNGVSHQKLIKTFLETVRIRWASRAIPRKSVAINALLFALSKVALYGFNKFWKNR
jgi:glycosyltransferase involved in cell wall biosynthesis